VPIYVQSATPFQALDVRLTFDPAAGSLVSARPTGVAAGGLVSQRTIDGRVSLSFASGAPVEASHGAVLLLEFRTDDTAALAAALVGALVDDQPAGVVTHARGN
jgi:hypothetical protein